MFGDEIKLRNGPISSTGNMGIEPLDPETKDKSKAKEQAEARIGKAADAAHSALEMADLFARLRASARQ